MKENNMIQQQSKKIGEKVYKTTPFSALEALRLKTKLLRLFSPAIGRFLGSVKDGSSILESALDGNQISGALEGLFQKLDEETFEELLRRLFKNTSATMEQEGKQKIFMLNDPAGVGFDMVFRGHLLEVYKVIAFVLEVNYPDFFGLMEGFGSQFQTLLSPKEGIKESE